MTMISVMGIINVTPDSFSQDGVSTVSGAIRRAQLHLKEGADILDVGGESSRPGSQPVSEAEERKRVVPVIQKLAKMTAIPISVDTYKMNVAQACLDVGAKIINHIQGTKINNTFLKMVARYQAHLVLMHMRGTPRTMAKLTNYKNLVPEMIHDLKASIEKCLENGIKSDKLIIDPGIGFAKTAEQNLEILYHLKDFKSLKKPILIGVSNKSFIGKILNAPVEDRLYGSLAANLYAAHNGASILRVHDVKPIKDALRVWSMIKHQPHPLP